MASEVTLKVFAYNVQMLDQAFWLHYKNTERAHLIGDILARSDYDVLIFSEAFDNDAREVLIKKLQKTFPERTAVVGNDDDIHIHHVLAAGFIAGGIRGAVWGPWGALGGALVGAFVGGLTSWLTGRPKSDGGVFIMSRWPIVLQGQIIYERSASEDRLGRKGVSWALVNKQGFHFNVFGTHTQADDKFSAIRQRQFEEIHKMYQAVAPNWQPSLIGGDLNVNFCFERDRCGNQPPPTPEPGETPPGIGGGWAHDRDRDPGGDPRYRGNPPGDADPYREIPVVKPCCEPQEREVMLNRLRAALPRDLSKFTYTRHFSNDLKEPSTGKKVGTTDTLDYVLHSTELDTVLHAANPRPSPMRPQPLRSSLETVKLRSVIDGRERDLSDHFAVLGTFTYPFVREDSHLFTGTWRCIKFNNQPDTHKHRLTFAPFGKQVLNEFDGKPQRAYVHRFYPGKASHSGKLLLKNVPEDKYVLYDYTFNTNEQFLQYFVPSVIDLPRRGRQNQTRPKPKNELLLRNAQQSVLYAFEGWTATEVSDDFTPGGPA